MDARKFLDTISTYMKPAGEVSDPFRFGSIDVSYTSGAARILFDGEATTSVKAYKFVSTYTPVAGQRVMLAAVSGSYVIVGAPATVGSGGGGASNPSGTILSGGWAAAPSGYLLCDGAAVSRTTNAALFSAIGTAYGVGDGSTTFNLPNMKGRVPVGLDAAQVEFDIRGEVGGAKTHTLAATEMPIHTHVQTAHNHTQVAHGHSVNRSTTAGGGSNRFSQGPSPTSVVSAEDLLTTVAVNNAATAVNQNAGGGLAHNNLQPYIVVTYAIKT